MDSGHHKAIANHFSIAILVAGLLTWIADTHEIRSNRESGYGRYDIMIIPRSPSGVGYVIEFKAVDKEANETVDSAGEAALRQIEEKKYETELVERGIKNIKELAVVFSGKDVHVKESNRGVMSRNNHSLSPI